VLDWIAEHTPTTPVNVMAQFHPDNFCDPGSSKYRNKYTEIARRPTSSELDASWHRARKLELEFETTTFEHRDRLSMTAMFGM
jgi:putative pyruvate formate lyase activating enzyme